MAVRLLKIVLLATCLLVVHASVTKREVPDAVIQPALTSYHNAQPGINLQSGSISYLVPDSKLGYVSTIQDLIVKDGFLDKIKATVPKMMKTVAKSLGKIAVAALTVVVVGATLASVVFLTGFLLCEFTSFCFLPAPINLTNFGNDNLEEAVRAYMAPDKLTALSNFVVSSIEKYSKKYKKTRNT